VVKDAIHRRKHLESRNTDGAFNRPVILTISEIRTSEKKGEEKSVEGKTEKRDTEKKKKGKNGKDAVWGGGENFEKRLTGGKSHLAEETPRKKMDGEEGKPGLDSREKKQKCRLAKKPPNPDKKKRPTKVKKENSTDTREGGSGVTRSVKKGGTEYHKKKKNNREKRRGKEKKKIWHP